MKSALVLGFYGRSNLGDEMFKETLPKLIPDFKCTFACTDRFFDLTYKYGSVSDYDAVICGGGDIFNDYFMDVIAEIVKNYTGPVYALGMGIPYPSVFDKGYLKLFDHVFLRENTDLPELTRRVGGRYAHFLPDLGFLKSFKSTNLKSNDKHTIGVFLATPMLSNHGILQVLIEFIKFAQDYGKIHLIRFNTSGSQKEDDKIIQDAIQKEIPQVNNDLTVYNTDEMIKLISTLDFAICTRFHAHIFATIAKCPFISISTTRKVDLYIKEHGLNDLQPKSLTFNDLTSTFLGIWEDLDFWKNKLGQIAKTNKSFLKTSQVNNLLLRSNGQKQRNRQQNIYELNLNDIHQSSRKLLFKLTGYDPETESYLNKIIPEPAARQVSANLCFELTNQPGSIYEWGTAQNIIRSPHKIREMIDWIWKDLIDKNIKDYSKLDINYYNQYNAPETHRAGWNFVLKYLTTVQTNLGVLCDTSVDRSFLWGKWTLKRSGIIPYTSMWIGFIHHTFNDIHSNNNTKKLLSCPEFIKSLPTCRGLICLSNYLSKKVHKHLELLGYSIPVISLYHPTIFVEKLWNSQNINSEIKLLQIGSWYRNPFTLYSLNLPDHFQKIALKGVNMEAYFPPNVLELDTEKILNPDPHDNIWIYYMSLFAQKHPLFNKNSKSLNSEIIQELYSMKNSVKILDKLDNSEYDDLLNQSVVFLHLIDASAVNTVIECMVRNTPVLVNRHPALEEYLGKNYPLFYDSPDQIPEVLTKTQIIQTSNYLQSMDKNFLTIECFLKNLINSEIYINLF